MATKCFWDKREKESDMVRYARSMKYRRLVEKRQLRSRKATPPLILFDSAPENAKDVLGDKEIMKISLIVYQYTKRKKLHRCVNSGQNCS